MGGCNPDADAIPRLNHPLDVEIETDESIAWRPNSPEARTVIRCDILCTHIIVHAEHYRDGGVRLGVKCKALDVRPTGGLDGAMHVWLSVPTTTSPGSAMSSMTAL